MPALLVVVGHYAKVSPYVSGKYGTQIHFGFVISLRGIRGNRTNNPFKWQQINKKNYSFRIRFNWGSNYSWSYNGLVGVFIAHESDSPQCSNASLVVCNIDEYPS